VGGARSLLVLDKRSEDSVDHFAAAHPEYAASTATSASSAASNTEMVLLRRSSRSAGRVRRVPPALCRPQLPIGPQARAEFIVVRPYGPTHLPIGFTSARRLVFQPDLSPFIALLKTAPALATETRTADGLGARSSGAQRAQEVPAPRTVHLQPLVADYSTKDWARSGHSDGLQTIRGSSVNRHISFRRL
jgi:hypothetical protein